MRYTQGEWNTDLQDGQVFDNGGLLVCNCYSSFRGKETIKANAKLIAAAPKLLEALQKIMDSASQTNKVEFFTFDKWTDSIKEAINKATL